MSSEAKCLVGMSPSIASSYPFICPFCIKSAFFDMQSCVLDLKSLKNSLSALESSITKLSLPPTVQSDLVELKSTVDQLSLKLASTPNLPAVSISPSSSKCSDPPSIPLQTSSSALIPPSSIKIPSSPPSHCPAATTQASSIPIQP